MGIYRPNGFVSIFSCSVMDIGPYLSEFHSVQACKDTNNGRDLSVLIHKVCSKVIYGDLKANTVIRCLQDVIVS